MANTGAQIGRGINLAARFAAGASGFGGRQDIAGTATNLLAGGRGAGASPTIGERVRGGFSAVSPTFATAENIRGLNELRQAQIGGIQAKGAATAAGAAADTTPFQIDSIMPQATEKMKTDLKQTLADMGADIDGNGIITQAELNKALPNIPKQRLIDGINGGITELTQTQTQNKNLLLQMPEFKKAQAVVPGITPENAADFFQKNPNLATTFPKLAESLQGQGGIQARIDGLTQRRGFVQTELDREATLPSVSQQNLNILQSPEFDADLRQAQGLLNRIGRNEDVGISIDEIARRLETQYPEIAPEIRGLLRNIEKGGVNIDIGSLVRDTFAGTAGNQP